MKNKLKSKSKIIVPRGAKKAIAKALETTQQSVHSALSSDYNQNSYLHLQIRKLAINDFFGQYKPL